MKHIGWCLDRIQIQIGGIPRNLDRSVDIALANYIVNRVEEYAETLAKIITNPKFKKSLDRLEKTSIEGVRLQAHEIEKLISDLKHMLYELDLYIKTLKEIIEKERSEKGSSKGEWSSKADQITLMIDQKFGGERGELRQEFTVALHSRKELKELEIAEKHIAEFFD